MRSSRELKELISNSGLNKVTLKFKKQIVLGLLAGMYISFGAIFYTVVTAYGGNTGVTKLLGGLAFCLGLVLVVIARAELFTGNTLLIILCLSKKLKLNVLLKNWTIIYITNFIGSIIIVMLMYFSQQYLQGKSEIGIKAMEIANSKLELGFTAAFVKGILCNILVCLAIWLTMISKTFSGKILGILFPITAFVAMGFEHSVANMYFIPMGIMIKNFAPEIFWEVSGLSQSNYSGLTFSNLFIQNLLPVTLGNILGGSLFVGTSYWFILKDE